MLDDEVIVQLDVAQARDHADKLLQTAEAAEQDAFMFQFAIEQVGSNPEGAGMLLYAFRKYRESKGKKGPSSDPNDFMVTDRHKKADDK